MTQTIETMDTENDAAATDAAALVDYLRERDVECPLCRYNLRGLQTSRCPECGRELRLGVWLAEPRLAAWVVGLVASMLPAGVGVLLLFAIIASGWPSPWTGAGMILFNLCLCAFIAWIPVAVAILVLRRRFLRLALSAQWMLAAALALVSVATFFVYVFAAPS